ncbi:uncharacterized protein LOC110098389, partial [Dendrobium catenatum]|uniref:uncharacterized protein LOC110098389 n=1 Tax=Dendrobium catenatum TaxID=906689 RepID=UPI0009F26E3E
RGLPPWTPAYLLTVAYKFAALENYGWFRPCIFGRVSKLSQRYVGPFEILERIGKSTYRLLLSDQMSDENLQYKEEPELILAYDVRKLRNKQIPMVKIQWKLRTAREATWEKESDMRQLYPHMF